MESAPNLVESSGFERINVSAAAIIRSGPAGFQLLSARRTEPPELAGGWEFPGGKWDPGEDAIAALVRELHEELGVAGVEVVRQVVGDLPTGAWTMGERYALHVFICRIPDGIEPQLLEQHDALLWLDLDEVESVAWLPVDLPPLRAAVAWLREQGE
jgi:8-oxo-dGTP diphosphatase